jgi:plasmid stabilization system protein ParE
MNVVYHPDVQKDVARILRYFDNINTRLGDEFWEELNLVIQRVAAHPKRCHFQAPNRRRANLKRFPYHFLFSETSNGIRITVLRHHKQHPEVGLQRR